MIIVSSILVKRRKDTARSIYDPLYISIRNPTRPIGNVLSAGFIYFNNIFSGSSCVGWDDIAEEWFKLECEKILLLWNQLGYIWHWCDFGGYHGDQLKGKLTFYGNFHAISSKCVRTQLWGNVILLFKVLMKALCLIWCIHILKRMHIHKQHFQSCICSNCATLATDMIQDCSGKKIHQKENQTDFHLELHKCISLTYKLQFSCFYFFSQLNFSGWQRYNFFHFLQ